MLPSGKLTVCELENGREQFVDLPIKKKQVIFHAYVNVYQRGTISKNWMVYSYWKMGMSTD